MQEENTENLAKRLSDEIKSSGIAKSALAEKVGIHPVTLSKYLRGNVNPGSDALLKLASVLRINARWLLTGEGPRDPVNLAEVRLQENPSIYDASRRSNFALPPSEAIKLAIDLIEAGRSDSALSILNRLMNHFNETAPSIAAGHAENENQTHPPEP